MRSSSAFKRLKTSYEDYETAINGVIAARNELIPTLKRGNSLLDVNRDGGSNCIAYALAGCALSLLVRDPYLYPIFVMRRNNAHTLIKAPIESLAGEVYRVDSYTMANEGLLAAEGEDALLYHLHRRPGTRIFTEMILNDLGEQADIRVFPPHVGPISDEAFDGEAAINRFTSQGFPMHNVNRTAPTLSVSGTGLVGMDLAVKEWYGLKQAVGGPAAAKAMSDPMKQQLPFQV